MNHCITQAQEKQISLSKSAAWYAGRGWKVFPLRPGTKEPFAGLGVYSATNDLEQIGAWWRRRPQANIGLHCGASGIIGLDLDQYKDTFGGNGFLVREDEETITNLTGGGGTHLLYAMPQGVQWGNRKGALPPGLDIRGLGGYLVLPPSIHPNGNRYQWENGYGPHEIELLPIPNRLRAVLEASAKYERTIGEPDRWGVKISCRIVEAYLDNAGHKTYGIQSHGEHGRKWIFNDCPFNPLQGSHEKDRAAFILVEQDGTIAAGCHHERCRAMLRENKTSGWQYLMAKRLADYE